MDSSRPSLRQTTVAELILVVTLFSILAGQGFRLTDLLTGKHSVGPAALSPGGELLLLGTDDGDALFEGSTGRILRRTRHEISAIAFSQDGLLVGLGMENGRIELRSVESWSLLASPAREGTQIRCLAFSPDGMYLIAGDEAGRIRAWNVKEQRTSYIVECGLTPVQALQVVLGGKSIAVAGKNSQRKYAVKILDIDGGMEIFGWATPSGPYLRTLAALPKGNYLVLRYSEINAHRYQTPRTAQIRVMDLMTRKTVAELDAYGSDSLVVSPDGKTIVAGGHGKITLWNLRDARLLHSLADRRSGVLAVTFASSGQKIIGAWRDGVVSTWNSKTGKLVAERSGFNLLPAPVPWWSMAILGTWLVTWIAADFRRRKRGGVLAKFDVGAYLLPLVAVSALFNAWLFGGRIYRGAYVIDAKDMFPLLVIETVCLSLLTLAILLRGLASSTRSRLIFTLPSLAIAVVQTLYYCYFISIWH